LASKEQLISSLKPEILVQVEATRSKFSIVKEAGRSTFRYPYFSMELRSSIGPDITNSVYICPVSLSFIVAAIVRAVLGSAVITSPFP